MTVRYVSPLVVLREANRSHYRRDSTGRCETFNVVLVPTPISSDASALWPTDQKRCPYCVEGSNFRVMAVGKGGDWYQCENCNHVSMPQNRLFECPCLNCYELGHHSLKRMHRWATLRQG